MKGNSKSLENMRPTKKVKKDRKRGE